MPKRVRNYHDSLLEDLRDPVEASEYLNSASEDSEEMFLVALRDVAEAKQMAKVAGHAGVTREALYRILSKTGNPTYSTLRGVLSAIGVRMYFMPTSGVSGAPKVATHTSQAIGSCRLRPNQSLAKKKGRSILGASRIGILWPVANDIGSKAPALLGR